MRKQFDDELNRIKAISEYAPIRSSHMLDDMGSAYITAFEAEKDLDTSLITVRSTRKLLRANGYTGSEVDDYMLENSYMSKTQIRKLRLGSLGDVEHSQEIADTRPALFTEKTTTDLIIDRLKSKPELLSALQRGVHKSNLTRTYGVNSPVLLQNFYDKHKEIINN